MTVFRGISRWLGAWLVAAVTGYLLACASITIHNLARLAALGIDIPLADAWQTVVFDIKGLSPTLGTIAKFGSGVWLGFLIAFPTAHLLQALVARLWRPNYLALFLFTLAGATSMATVIAITDAQYDVSLVSGTSGVTGYLAQLLAGAVAGAVFALAWRATAPREAA